MQCELVFYVAHKTGHNHGIFNKKLSNTELKVTKTMVATSPVDLGEQLKASLKRSNLIFIIGGLLRSDETNIVDILSKSLESNSKGKINCKRIENANGSCDGYIVESGMQMIVMLPDSPEELNAMAGSVLMRYISDFYGLKYYPKKGTKADFEIKHISDANAFYNTISSHTAQNSDKSASDDSPADLISKQPKRVRIALGIFGIAFLLVAIFYLVVMGLYNYAMIGFD